MAPSKAAGLPNLSNCRRGYLLLRLAQTAQTAVNGPLAFARLVRANLMHRKRIDRLLVTDPIPRFNSYQMTLQWA